MSLALLHIIPQPVRAVVLFSHQCHLKASLMKGGMVFSVVYLIVNLVSVSFMRSKIPARELTGLCALCEFPAQTPHLCFVQAGFLLLSSEGSLFTL